MTGLIKDSSAVNETVVLLFVVLTRLWENKLMKDKKHVGIETVKQLTLVKW